VIATAILPLKVNKFDKLKWNAVRDFVTEFLTDLFLILETQIF
jgi:hypothetical protein